MPKYFLTPLRRIICFSAIPRDDETVTVSMIFRIESYHISTVPTIFIRVPVSNIKADHHRLGVFLNSVLSLCNIFTNNQHRELQMQKSVMEGGWVQPSRAKLVQEGHITLHHTDTLFINTHQSCRLLHHHHQCISLMLKSKAWITL